MAHKSSRVAKSTHTQSEDVLGRIDVLGRRRRAGHVQKKRERTKNPKTPAEERRSQRKAAGTLLLEL